MNCDCSKSETCGNLKVINANFSNAKKVRSKRSRQMPDDIANNPKLDMAIMAKLPQNYSFEIKKTLWRVRQLNCKVIALQFPEGLTMFACAIADVLLSQSNGEIEHVVIMGDITYGACCVDDFSASALGATLLMHYGHSCLIPITDTLQSISALYVFVDIEMQIDHLQAILKKNLPPPPCHIALLSIVQFVCTLQKITPFLRELGYKITIPQSRPLSPGEVLGCTSPSLPNDVDLAIFIGDGRFHLESLLISVPPSLPVLKYDPYNGALTRERYDHNRLLSTRMDSIHKAKRSKTFGLVLSTLGRQGSPKVLDHVISLLDGCDYIVVLMSEISDAKLKMFTDVECWVQIACPRLSIDWGPEFSSPILTPYELSVAKGAVSWQKTYPMDYYSNESLGPWTPKNSKHKIDVK